MYSRDSWVDVSTCIEDSPKIEVDPGFWFTLEARMAVTHQIGIVLRSQIVTVRISGGFPNDEFPGKMEENLVDTSSVPRIFPRV